MPIMLDYRGLCCNVQVPAEITVLMDFLMTPISASTRPLALKEEPAVIVVRMFLPNAHACILAD